MKNNNLMNLPRGRCSHRSRFLVATLIVCSGGLLGTGLASAAGTATSQVPNDPFPLVHIFTFLILMLGPFKIIGPFAKVTRGADAALRRQIALQAILFSTIALLIAGFAGEYILTKYTIPLPILALTAGIILFLVALQNTLSQFGPKTSGREAETVPNPTLKEALSPIAFPTIVTPYGIAALVVFLSFSSDLQSQFMIGGVVLAVMLLNLVVMLNVWRIGPVLNIALAILGAVIGVIQVALGLQIINNSLKALGIL
ncbi:MAG: MarC family protein [Gammaproteobacteria bacterium]|jgi:multiple antibiotic resistance protein